MTPEVLIPEATIARRVDELARELSVAYADSGELLLVGVLRGAFIFLADLARRLTVPHRVDFIALSRYEQGAVGGAVRLLMDVRVPVTGRHVLVVEDIVDSGETLVYLQGMLRARGPASLKTCVLTRKPGAIKAKLAIDYVGFDIPDRWVVGYGLDFGDQYRTLPYIAAFDPPGS